MQQWNTMVKLTLDDDNRRKPMVESIEQIREKLLELVDRILTFISGERYELGLVKERIPNPYRIAALNRRFRNVAPSAFDCNRF